METATQPVTDVKTDAAPEMISAGQIVAKMLKQEGIQHIFTISGGHIVDIYNGCIDEGIEIVDVRHEQVAAHAADAYARITGLGCAVVTAGPGTTDAVTGMANAYRAESPMLLIGGNSPLKQYRMGGLQELRHTEMMTPISKFASLVMTTDRTAEMMGIAFREMYNGAPGPGFLEIPHDVMDGKVEASKVRYPKNYRVKGSDGGAPDFIGDPKIVEQVADLLAKAERPVALFGTQARTCRAHDAIDRFSRHFNMPIYVNGSARGTLPRNHSYALHALAQDRVRQRRRDPAGGHAARFPHGLRPAPQSKSQDRDHGHGLQERRQQSRLRFRAGRQSAHDRECDVRSVAGRHRRASTIRSSRCCARMRPRRRARTTRSSPRTKSRSIPCACATRSTSSSRKTRFTSATAATSSRSRVPSCGRTNRADGWIPARSAHLGVGTGFAMASKLAQPKRDVVVLYGDCSFTLTGFDFITMVHRKLPYVGVIGNNSSWNQIRFGQERKYPGRGDIGNVVGDVRFDHLAQAMGGFGIRVTKPEDIRPALEKARDSGMPALVDVVINRDVYSSGTSNQTMYK